MSATLTHCTVRKFTDTHLRNTTYDVKLEDCFLVPGDFSLTTLSSTRRYPLNQHDSDEESTVTNNATPSESLTEEHPTPLDPVPPLPAAIPPELTQPPDTPANPIPATHDVILPLLRTTRKRQPPSYLKDYDLS